MSRVITRYESEQAWRDARAVTIGASDAPAVLGASPYETPVSLYFSKLGIAPNDDEARATLFRIAHAMEPVIADLYRDLAPEPRPILNPLPFAVYQNPEFPEWMTCTPDRLIVTDKGEVPLELKNVDWRLGFEWIEEPPLIYVIQLQHQMAVLGADEGVLAALVGGNSFRWVALKRDDEFIDRILVPAISKFMWCLVNHVPPDPDDSERTKAAIKAAYPRHVPNKVVPLPPDLIDWDLRRQEAIKGIKELERVKTEAESRLLLALGDAERGELSNGIAYTNRLQSRKETTVRASEFRVLRRSGGKATDNE